MFLLKIFILDFLDGLLDKLIVIFGWISVDRVSKWLWIIKFWFWVFLKIGKKLNVFKV